MIRTVLAAAAALAMLAAPAIAGETFDLGGSAKGVPSTVAYEFQGEEAFGVFVRGPQNHVFMNSLIGSKWTDWKDLQGVVDGEISCARVFKLGAHCYDSSGKGVLQLMDVTHKTGKDVVTQNLGGAVSGKVSA